jgi:heat shock protein HspQ
MDIFQVSFFISDNDFEDFFLASPAIRSPRSEYVKYRVGQVIRHKIYGYRAVIIGWDEIASAPDEWLDEHHQGHPVSLERLFYIIKRSFFF